MFDLARWFSTQSKFAIRNFEKDVWIYLLNFVKTVNMTVSTVVTEATRTLEDRLRSLSKASATCVGVDLAKHAFATPNLIVSDIPAEQDSAHLLYRGVFGFLRNSVHHRLVNNLQPERVLQIVGMVDYLISVAEAARRKRRKTMNMGRKVESRFS